MSLDGKKVQVLDKLLQKEDGEFQGNPQRTRKSRPIDAAGDLRYVLHIEKSGAPHPNIMIVK